MIEDFIRPAREAVACKHMVVVQQDPQASLFEWANTYRFIASVWGPPWIAFPRILGDRRVELIYGLHILSEVSVNTKHHAFGMNAGSLTELPTLNSLGVYSCDSSAPVWRGLQGRSLHDSWADIPFDPDFAYVGTQYQELADTNLQEVMRACRSTSVIQSPIKAAAISAPR